MKMIRKILIITGMTLLIVSLGYVFFIRDFSQKNPIERLLNCDIQIQACTQRLSDREITLDIQPRPVKTMDNLLFTIKVDGPPLSKKPHIDLSMPGMNMGLNWVFLKTRSPGIYEGTGTIVKCPTGKTIWQATVTLPEIGTVDFVFNVK